MEFLEARVIYYDTMKPFVIPDYLGEYYLKVEDWWGYPGATGVNLSKRWSNIFLQKSILFQRGSYDHSVDYEDIVSCEWRLE